MTAQKYENEAAALEQLPEDNVKVLQIHIAKQAGDFYYVCDNIQELEAKLSSLKVNAMNLKTISLLFA